MQVTKEIKRLLLKADMIIIVFLEKNKTANKFTPFEVDVRLCFEHIPRTNFYIDKNIYSTNPYSITLKSTGTIKNGYCEQILENDGYYSFARDKNNIYAPKKGVWSFQNATFNEHLHSVLKSIPLYSTLTWEVLLDNGNSICIKHKLHTDELYLEVNKNKKTTKFLVDHVTGKYNSARFGEKYSARFGEK